MQERERRNMHVALLISQRTSRSDISLCVAHKRGNNVVSQRPFDLMQC